jgi:hypothetical protein
VNSDAPGAHRKGATRIQRKGTRGAAGLLGKDFQVFGKQLACSGRTFRSSESSWAPRISTWRSLFFSGAAQGRLLSLGTSS